VPVFLAGAVQSVVARGGERTISLYNIHTRETVSVVYKKDGKYVEAGLAKVNHVLRDHRRDEATRMDPELIDLLWEMHNELGSKEPIHVISGYRSRATNEHLRKTVGGQASESRHILGKAADVHFPDVPVRNLRYSALIRERGGVGYYPTSAIPFVHVDTDRVRSWPRLPRHELALLFPSGATRHLPADGGPITPSDVASAQKAHRDLALQVAQFHDLRRAGGTAVALAGRDPAASGRRQMAALSDATADPPRLLEAPRRISAPGAAMTPFTPPPADDRAKLAALAELADRLPQLIAGPSPARRPPPAAQLPSLSGNAQITGLAPAQAPQPKAPRFASAGDTHLPVGGLVPSGPGNAWIASPAFDDEHPEELSYRPFPIAPFLTATAGEPLMANLVHHDVARTVEFIGQPGSSPALRFRPGVQAAQLLWAQQFTGEAVGLQRLREAQIDAVGGLLSRPVRTSQK